MLYTIVTSSRAGAIGDGLTYLSAKKIPLGSLVKVPLRTSTVEGIVVKQEEDRGSRTFQVKSIQEVLSASPLFPPALLKTMFWMSEYYFCPLRTILKAAFPPPPWKKIPSSEEQPQAPKGTPHASERPELSLTLSHARLISLLTDALKEGSAIVLAPEIFSAKRLYDTLTKTFGEDRVMLLHGSVSTANRRTLFQSIRTARRAIVVGTRSAVFAPLFDLKLVLLTEEHDSSYKSDQTPRTHTRLVAEVLCRLSQATLVLTSASPSLESWHHAHLKSHASLSPRYELTQEGGSTKPPKVQLIDLKATRFGAHYPLSPALMHSLLETLNRKEQTVLLLNRRGDATALLCRDCHRTIDSPKTSLPLTLHTVSGNPALIDHKTGETYPVPARCPHCSSPKLHSIGAGTEKVEQLMRAHFPQARMLRFDADTRRERTLETVVSALEGGKLDILIGTHPVLHALKAPSVTLGAMIIADTGLSLPHFRAGERVFQTITQMRSLIEKEKQTELLLQTFRPEAPEIKLAAEGKVEEYLNAEEKLREETGFPPATQIISLIVRGEGARKRAQILLAEVNRIAAVHCTASLSPSHLDRGRAWRVILRGTAPRAVVSKLNLQGVIVDVDPVDM